MSDSRSVQAWRLIFPNGVSPEDYELALSISKRAEANAPVRALQIEDKNDGNGHTEPSMADKISEIKATAGGEKPYVNVKTAADMSGKSVDRLYGAISKDELKTVMRPGLRGLVKHIEVAELEAWMAANSG